MNTEEIIKLASILRENGSEVLNGASKLILSFDLWAEVNESFSLIEDQRDAMTNSFQVVNNTNARVEIFSDLQFLHDFIQRTVSLKLTPLKKKYEKADLTKFKNLKLLEIYNLNVEDLYGLVTLKGQLQFLICTNKSIRSLKDILLKCGGDEDEGGVWNELREAIFSYNALTSLDSLEFAPSLHTLDLSRNELVDVTELTCLNNLKKLNLGFNKLISAPNFSGLTCNRLEVLVLSNNFIEDITKISHLENLSELDLGDNCLIEHKSLGPLANLATLQWLNLVGNPLSYHPQHRNKTSSCLHSNTGTVRFVLDQSLLTKNERKLVGSLHPRIIMKPPSRMNSTEPILNSCRIRNATITDDDSPPTLNTSLASISSLVTSGEHLQTKKQIEQIREQYGEEWLMCHPGSLVQSALGIEQNITMHSTPYGSADLIIQAEIKPNDRNKIEKKTTPETTLETYETAPETTDETFYQTPNVTVDESDDDFGDGDESLYLAVIKGQSDPIILVITETHIFERGYIDAKEQTRWSIESLVHFKSTDEYIEIEFDTVRNALKQRSYLLEEAERQRLKNALKNIIDNRPPAENLFKVYKCLKCSTQFGVEKCKRMHDTTPECPSCKSQLVFEDDE